MPPAAEKPAMSIPIRTIARALDYASLVVYSFPGAASIGLTQEEAEITARELAEIVHGHPTVSEALMEAATDALGRYIHLPPKRTNEQIF